MYKIITVVLLIKCCLSYGQHSFEGYIKFSTKITTTELASKDFKQKLIDKYGDSLKMYYSKLGDFRRTHLNSAEFGSDSQIYKAKTGILYYTSKNSSEIDSLNTKINSLEIISKRKLNDEVIMNLQCDCYEIKAISLYNQNVILNYCYSSKSPKINHKLFSKHNDFFLNDYYRKAKRPYLKFSIETELFKIIYSATQINNQPISKELFEVK